jgi:hypothetical protein
VKKAIANTVKKEAAASEKKQSFSVTEKALMVRMLL